MVSDFTLKLIFKNYRLSSYGEEPITKEYEVLVLKISEEEQETVNFTFFALNDFHGSIIDDNGGLSVIGNYIIEEEKKMPLLPDLENSDNEGPLDENSPLNLGMIAPRHKKKKKRK